MEGDARILVAGARGMVGSALVRALRGRGFEQVLSPTSSEVDLRSQQAVQDYFMSERPDYVLMAAAKVGGIVANNTYRAAFLYDNLLIASNTIHSAYLSGVKKLMFFGSSCIYPKLAEQPLKEEYLLTGPLEYTNEPYAIAKIAGIKLCETYRQQYGCNFISVMPTNLYGPGDNYHPTNSHVMPALIRKFHEAKLAGSDSVEIWGRGTPLREFLYVDDLAEASLLLMEKYDGEGFINIGYGSDISIRELAETISTIVGYEGKLIFDHTKPDGAPRKLMDSSKVQAFGWKPAISLEDGILLAYKDFLTYYGRSSH